MAIKLRDLWPGEKSKEKVLVMQLGGCATFGDRTIMQTPIHDDRKGGSECWLCSTTMKGWSDDELLSVVKMKAGMDLKIQKNDKGIRGVKFYDPDGAFLEFAPFTEDGKGLNYDLEYEHISIDPANNGHEAQLVIVN